MSHYFPTLPSYYVRRLVTEQVNPAAVNGHREDHRKQQDSPTGNLPFREGRGKDKAGTGAEPFRLLLEAADDLAAFEPEIVGIGADETDRVGRTWPFPAYAALDRRQARIVYANPADIGRE